MRRVSVLALAAMFVMLVGYGCGGSGGTPQAYSCVDPYTPLVGSWATIGGTTYTLACGHKTIDKQGLTKAHIVSSVLTDTGLEAVIDANVEGSLFNLKQVTVKSPTTAVFQGVTYTVNSGQKLEVRPDANNPLQIYTTGAGLTTDNGNVSLNMDEGGH